MKKHTLVLIGILIVATIFRFWQLGQIPVSMSDDETRLSYNAYSIWKTAKDIDGHILPLAFVVSGYAFNPVAIYITSPFVGIFGLTMFTSRLPFAIGGIITVFLLYKITYLLLKNKNIALLSSLALSISSWHLQMSRIAYEGTLALLLYLLGIFVFLSIKSRKIFTTVLAMLAFLGAFYSYSGTKLIFLPIIGILVWYKFREFNYKQLAIIGVFSLLAFASFFVLSKTQNAAQYGRQFFFQDAGKVSEAVELERRGSSAPELIKKMYHNKLTYWSKIFFEHYSYAFSPQYLFLNQEGNGIFATWFRGQMYYVEAPLVLLGIFFLFLRKRKEFLLMLLFLVIAPIPSGLGAEPFTYTFRSSFMLPWLMIFVGSGIYSLAYFFKSRNIKISAYILLVAFYMYFIGGYINRYYFEWSRYGAKYYSKADQDLSFLINKIKDNKKLIIVTNANFITFLQYAFYSKIPPEFVQKLNNTGSIKFNNIIFQQTCPQTESQDPRDIIEKGTIYAVFAECPDVMTKFNPTGKPDYTIKSPEGLNEWLIFEK